MITVLYLLISIIKLRRIPESISETSYLWKGKVNWFTIYCIILATTLFIPWLSKSKHLEFIPFLGCVGILMAGVTPYFKDSFYSKIHYVGGLMSLLSVIIWLISNQYYISLLTWLGLFIILSIIKRQSWVFFGEIIGLIILMYNL